MTASSSASVVQAAGRCAHCGAASESGLYCCIGCRAAAQILDSRGLERARQLRDEPLPKGAAPTPRAWLDGASASIDVDVQGITCGACVWTLERIAEQDGVVCHVNPGAGRMQVQAQTPEQLSRFLDAVETLGYRMGPALKGRDPIYDSLVLRTGIAAAVAMVAMSFSFSRYFGLDPSTDGLTARVFLWGEFITGAIAFVVGGSWFIGSSVRALRRGVIALDVPIALGIVLAFFGSSVSLLTTTHGAVFFDSVAMFVALMLGGRLVQQGVLKRSRAQLLEDAGLDALHVVRVEDSIPRTIRASAVNAGDLLLLRPSDVVPVACALHEAEAAFAEFSLAWVTGEADTHNYDTATQSQIPAGACLVGEQAVLVRAVEAARDSNLGRLLSRQSAHAGAVNPLWQKWATVSVVFALGSAIVAAVFYGVTDGLAAALEVATAVLVVTCPCALGLSIPLAEELSHASLKRRGVFVKSPGLMDRLVRIRAVFLDKTGTITRASLRLDEPSRTALGALSLHDAAVLFDMVSRSAHPKSVAIAAALPPRPLTGNFAMTQTPGQGVFAVFEGHRYALARDEDATAFSKDGHVLVRVNYDEDLAAEAELAVQALLQRGLDVRVVSGDNALRAQRVAQRLGIPRVHADLSPEGKADVVRDAGGAAVMFVGDGVNDVAAFAEAGASGTPALDRPQLPARADFFFTGVGLLALDAMFDTAARYQRAVRTTLISAVVYNVVAVAAALLGWASPAVCAVLMPVSSVVLMALVLRAFRQDKAGTGSANRLAMSTRFPGNAAKNPPFNRAKALAGA